MVIVLIGPAGAGKTTIGIELARSLGWRFVDADSFHSERNRARMQHGNALTDVERAPWLAELRAEVERAEAHGDSMVLACSALRRAYREALLPRSEHAAAQVRFVYLKTSTATLDSRLRTRAGHFAPPELLASQLATLEEPQPEERILTLDGGRPVDAVVAQIHEELGV